jgi:NADH-quinone oxidoreductase subunit N
LFSVLGCVFALGAEENWFPEVRAVVTAVCWVLALASMTVGNVLALLQQDAKRLLAYSSVAHAGYLLVGLGAALKEPASEGQAAVLFYLCIYAASALAAFGMLAYVNDAAKADWDIEDLSGLSQSQPGIALVGAAALLSLAGIPPTAGFWAKVYIVLSAWSSGGLLYRVLAIALAVNAAIAVWYYLRLVAVMYLRQPGRPVAVARDIPGLVGLGACVVFVLSAFLLPGVLWQTARSATTTQASAVLHATSAPAGPASGPPGP